MDTLKIKNMNTHVDFKTAKLLKEKGFDLPCRFTYTTNKEVLFWYPHECFNGYNLLKDCSGSLPTNIELFAPTIAEVVMWLYEKHNIILESHWEGTSEIDSFDARIIVLGKHILSKEYKDFKLSLDASSPTEAYEAAINYTLKNLIK